MHCGTLYKGAPLLTSRVLERPRSRADAPIGGVHICVLAMERAAEYERVERCAGANEVYVRVAALV
jgi:hypothetical protein